MIEWVNVPHITFVVCFCIPWGKNETWEMRRYLRSVRQDKPFSLWFKCPFKRTQKDTGAQVANIFYFHYEPCQYSVRVPYGPSGLSVWLLSGSWRHSRASLFTNATDPSRHAYNTFGWCFRENLILGEGNSCCEVLKGFFIIWTVISLCKCCQ